MNGSAGRAALFYSGIVFTAGFALGTLRTFCIAPRLGELPAVCLELPGMLAVSWLVCGSAVRRYGLRGRRAGWAMGAGAFALLMMAELALAVLAFGRSPAAFLLAFGRPAGAVGLAGQIAFGLMPGFRAEP